MLSLENEIDLFEEINLLKLEWFKEINIKRQDQNDSSYCSSPYRVELAHRIYASGQRAEISGYLQIAVEQYRRATCLVHDIERKMKYYEIQSRFISDTGGTNMSGGERNSDYGDDENRGPQAVEDKANILQLPDEVLLHIMRWVIGDALDIYSLLLQGLVCSKFLSLSRDEHLWRLICIRLWPQCRSSDLVYFGGNWLSMVKKRPHLLFHGCYLGSTSYVRKGEPTVNTVSTPFLLVRYFRVFRFRSDGSVLMLTSAQDPQDIVRMVSALDRSGCNGFGMLPPQSNMGYSVAVGNYNIDGQMVFVHLVRSSDTGVAMSHKFSRTRKAALEEPVDKHHLDMVFQIKASRRWPHHALRWKDFSLTNNVSVTQFDTRTDKYPTLVFSRVREFSSRLSQSAL